MISTVFSNMGPGIVRERFSLTVKDCTAAALTQTITLKAVPKGTVFLGSITLPRTAFAGGGIGSCTLKVGLAAGATDIIGAAGDVAAAVADTTFYTSGSKIGTTFPILATKAADSLTVTFTTTTTNVNTMTAGAVDVDVFYFLTEDLTGTGPAGNSNTGGGLLL